MIEWEETALGNLCKFQAGDAFSKDKQGSIVGDVPFIKVSDMNLSGNEHFINVANNWISQGEARNYRLHPAGAVVFAKIGEALKANRRRLLTRPTIIDNNMMSAIAFAPVDDMWFFYLLRTLDFNEVSRGSALPYLATSDLQKIPLTLPPVDQQKAISSVLSLLDKKIELNRRMNETLEAMAQAIFRDWFVDFGPVRRKMTGATDPVKIMGGLIPDPARAAELAALFPDRLGEDELPEGWSVDQLGALTELQNGYAFKSSDWMTSGIPVIKIGSVKPGVVDLTSASFVSASLAKEKEAFRLSSGDMVVGLTGYVGETGRVPPLETLPLLNQRVARFRPKKGCVATVFAAVRDPAFRIYAEAKAHGSAQPNVSTKDLLNYPVLVGSLALVTSFEKIAAPLFSKALQNLAENTVLAETRDYLLPRLMSGEMRVSDIEPARLSDRMSDSSV